MGRISTIIATVVLGTIAIIALPKPAASSATGPDNFSIIVVNDVHYDSTNVQNPGSVAALNSAVSWITNPTNISTWNIKAVLVNGDHTFDNYTSVQHGTVDADWSPLATAWNTIHDAGIPILPIVGNHDVNPSGQSYACTDWNTYIGPLVSLWAPTNSAAQWNNSWYCPLPAVNAYFPLDITVQGTLYKLAVAALKMQGIQADMNSLTAMIDANPDRQFIFATHMFLISAATSKDKTIHPCVYGEYACTSDPGGTVNWLDGASMWNIVKNYSNLILTSSGHYHEGAAMRLTATDGHEVGAMSGYSTARNNTGNIVILNFKPLANSIDAYSWKTTTNTADSSFTGTGSTTTPGIVSGGKVTFAWTPKPTPDTTPPTITMTAPANGATLSGTVLVSATANDDVGVTGVQFLLDGAALGSEQTTAPYSIPWDTTAGANGPHTLAARARDAAGNQTTSALINVTVSNADTTSPAVSITAPAPGATVSGAVTVSANATDNVGVAGVQFLLDGGPLGTESITSPYSTSWDSSAATNGAHTLSAVARDAAGNRTTSATVSITVSNDTTPPTVSISAPANGGSVSGSVSVSATATDNVGVAGVQFLLDGANLGTERTTSPYSISWDSSAASNGAHTLSATARDAAGNRTTSATVSVTVDNAPPTASITAPATGAVLSGTLTISANATDNVGVAGVQFLLDGAPLGAESVTSPYSISWDTGAATNGAHTLSATARDAAGNRTTSANVSVTVDNTPPVVSITAPASAATVSGAVTVSANATDNVGVAGVQFLLDGAPLGAESITSPYSVSWDTNAATNSAHTLSAVARDTAGNRTTSASVSVTVLNDNTPPTVSITAPVNGAAVSGAVTVSANATDNVGVAGVQFLLDGANLGTERTTSPYSISWDSSTATNGAHTLSAIARDAAGNRTTSATVSVTVDLTPPTVSISAPTNGAAVSGAVTVSANASDNVGVAGVQFLLDGANLGTERTTSPYSVSWDSSTATNGAHTLSAIARDAAGNRTTSATVSVTVDTTPPTVSISAPASGATVSGAVTVSANATDNVGVAGVQFLLDGANLGTERTTSPYSVSWDSSTATNGAHTLSAVARDAAGNRTTSATVSVTVDTTPPTVSISAPTNGATVSGAVTVSANATDNVGVAGVQFLLDGAPLGAEITTSPYSISWDTNAATNSAHTLSAVARDSAGNRTTSATVSVTVLNDTTPPAVSITAPGNGATVSGTVTVSATATDNVGVAGVQFLLDGAPLGTERTASPYSISWDTSAATNSAHTLSAVARDAAGNRTTSATVSVSVLNDTTPPAVSITAPGNGATVSGTVTVSANATDNVGVAGVQFLLDGAPLGTERTASPYSISWDTSAASNSAHTLSAVARDGAGNRTTSATVSVTVLNDTTPPTVSITAPGNGATVSGTVTVSAGASDNVGVAGVQFLLDGATLGAEITTSPYSISWNSTTATNGTHTLSAVARDAAGNRTTSATVSVTVLNDTTPPAVSITAPGNGATVSGPVTVSASASDNVGVVGVQFLLDGAPLGAEITTSPYSISWNSTTATNGTHTLSAVARDAAGNRTTSAPASVTVFNDTTPPTVSITAPGNGASVSGTVTVSASASDNVGVVGVQFLLDGAALGAEDTASPYSISWNSTTATNGTHTLSAVARDAAGNRTTSAPVTVTVFNDTTPPTVSMTAPAGGSTVSGTVTVSASASDNVGVVGVQFLLDGAALGAETTVSPYSISWNSITATNGVHTLSARARDAAGNRTTSTVVSVTVSNIDTTPPTVVITSPANGATISGPTTVSANATDNFGVAGVQFLLDGTLLAPEDTKAPYSMQWNPNKSNVGAHTLTAIARDAAGNKTTTSITITIK